MLANHTNIREFSRPQAPEEAFLASFEKNSHSDAQRQFDHKMILALGRGSLMQSNPETGRIEPSHRYYAPSKTGLISKVVDGVKTYNLTGGWVSKAAANRILQLEADTQALRHLMLAQALAAEMPEDRRRQFIHHIDPSYVLQVA
jgi:hypothetical protein